MRGNERLPARPHPHRNCRRGFPGLHRRHRNLRGLEVESGFMKLSWWVMLVLLLTGCSPRVGLETPEEPITINLNVKIDHEIRLKVEDDIDELFGEDSDL